MALAIRRDRTAASLRKWARQAGDPFRRDQRVIERSQQKVAAPDDFRAGDVRQTLVDRIDKGVTGIVEGLRDDPARHFVSLGRHDRTQPRETRASARKITARRQCGQHIGTDDRLDGHWR